MPAQPIARARRGRLPSGAQLYALNEQGLLRVELVADAFQPGGPADGWPVIERSEAAALLARLVAERWLGLGRWPRKGEAWVVREGLVCLLGTALEDEART